MVRRSCSATRKACSRRSGCRASTAWPACSSAQSRGLFVYSPFLMMAVAGPWLARFSRERRLYWFAAITFAAGTLFLSTFPAWDGGWGYGTRLMTDLVPYAMLLLIPVWEYLNGPARHGVLGHGRVCRGSPGLWSVGLWRPVALALGRSAAQCLGCGGKRTMVLRQRIHGHGAPVRSTLSRALAPRPCAGAMGFDEQATRDCVS